jgi:hypothetical protein
MSKPLTTPIVGMLLVTSSALAGITPVEVDRFFAEPNQPTEVRFQMDPPPTGSLPCVISDYWQRPVAKSAAAAGKDGSLTVSVNLPAGYYQLDFPDASFGLVVIPARQGPPDPFFCIDASLTWLVNDKFHNANLRTGLIKALPRCGVSMARERVDLGALCPAPNTYDWDVHGPQNYFAQTCRQTYAKYGVPVLELFHNAPAWTETNPYPRNLLAVGESWQEIARHWSAYWGGLEIWNEPDSFFGGNLPADQYVPIVKTIAFALAEADVKTPLVGGVFDDLTPESFRQTCAANGLLDQVDAISFHNYRPAGSLESLVATHRAWVTSAGKESMPLWITECGRPWPRGPARPPMAQDAASALDIVAQTVESRACGIARHFPFVYAFYEEADISCGMMGKEGTPLRCMAAYAQCIAALSGLDYLGDLTLSDANAIIIKRARVFGDANRVVAVLFSGQTRNGATVQAKLPIMAIQGIDGRTLAATGDDSIPIPDGLTYVWLNPAKLHGLLKTDTLAAALWASSHKAPPQHPAPSPIILQYLPDPNAVYAFPTGYMPQTAEAAEYVMRVRVHNLSAQARKVRLTLPPSKTCDGPPPKAVEIEAPARGVADADLRIDLAQFVDQRAQAAVTVCAQADGVARIDPLMIRVRPNLTVEAMLKLFPISKSLPVADLSRWTKNIVGDGQMRMSATPDGHWVLDVKFAKGDPWVYPFFALHKGGSLPRACGLVIRAKCDGAADVKVMLHESGKGEMVSQPIIPADGKWHAAMVSFDDLPPHLSAAPFDFDAKGNVDLKTFDSLTVGLNGQSPDKHNVLEVSDIWLVGE